MTGGMFVRYVTIYSNSACGCSNKLRASAEAMTVASLNASTSYLQMDSLPGEAQFQQILTQLCKS
jgi:hypothetical protein